MLSRDITQFTRFSLSEPSRQIMASLSTHLSTSQPSEPSQGFGIKLLSHINQGGACEPFFSSCLIQFILTTCASYGFNVAEQIERVSDWWSDLLYKHFYRDDDGWVISVFSYLLYWCFLCKSMRFPLSCERLLVYDDWLISSLLKYFITKFVQFKCLKGRNYKADFYLSEAAKPLEL